MNSQSMLPIGRNAFISLSGCLNLFKACQLALIEPRSFVMRVALKAGIIASLLLAAPVVAQAGTLEGVAIGAGAGAVVAGPPGAVVGGVIGAVVGGPNIFPSRRHYYREDYTCWRDDRGYRHCSR
jgi:osmotically inducible lipoprotein OsmB